MRAYSEAPVITMNADFTDGAEGSLANIRAMLPGAVIAFIQEAREVQLREKLTRLMGVRQGKAEDTAGSALVFDLSRCEALRGGQVLAAVPEPGDELQRRWLRWCDLRIDRVLTLRAIAGHRPLKSTGDQPEFDQALGELVDSSPHPVIAGLDTNSYNPHALAENLGLEWRGKGIDGFMHDEQLQLGTASRLRPTHSDHRAVMATLRVPVRH